MFELPLGVVRVGRIRQVVGCRESFGPLEVIPNAEMVQGKLADKAPAELMKRFEELKAAFS